MADADDSYDFNDIMKFKVVYLDSIYEINKKYTIRAIIKLKNIMFSISIAIRIYLNFVSIFSISSIIKLLISRAPSNDG